MGWAAGEVVEWRETWHGRVLATMPVEVVLDQADVLAVYIREGSPFTFPDEWPWGSAHPWSVRGRWEGHGALVLHRPDDAYTVWAFWEGAERAFEGWYVNFQRPFARGATTLDTLDHEVSGFRTRVGGSSRILTY